MTNEPSAVCPVLNLRPACVKVRIRAAMAAGLALGALLLTALSGPALGQSCASLQCTWSSRTERPRSHCRHLLRLGSSAPQGYVHYYSSRPEMGAANSTAGDVTSVILVLHGLASNAGTALAGQCVSRMLPHAQRLTHAWCLHRRRLSLMSSQRVWPVQVPTSMR